LKETIIPAFSMCVGRLVCPNFADQKIMPLNPIMALATMVYPKSWEQCMSMRQKISRLFPRSGPPQNPHPTVSTHCSTPQDMYKHSKQTTPTKPQTRVLATATRNRSTQALAGREIRKSVSATQACHSQSLPVSGLPMLCSRFACLTIGLPLHPTFPKRLEHFLYRTRASTKTFAMPITGI
jgi:hypothetical protein